MENIYTLENRKVKVGYPFLIGKSILVVEDNRMNVLLLKRYLNIWGAKVRVAGNGAEALSYIQQQVFDLVLMDIQMPVMDGYAAAGEIRKLPGDYYAYVPIIALTSLNDDDLMAKTAKVGMNDCVRKPFDPEHLLSRIQALSV